MVLPIDEELVFAALRAGGARFAYLFGSYAEGTARSRSDVDVAAFYANPGTDPVAAASDLPPGVDLLVLDAAPLELAGRVAMQGRLLFDDDPSSRVEWEATTRKIYLDEQPRIIQARRDFVAARAHGRR